MIELETSTNGLYKWEYKIENKDIVKFYKKTKEDKNKDSIIEKYYFKSLKPGKTSIKFTYKNTKNGSYDEIKYYSITVNKNLKLKIKEKNS